MGASYPTKLTLAARSGDRCAFPGCDRKLTVDGKFAKAAFTGQAAHIAGEKPDAARYDATMTAEQRDGVDNLIYLCRDHHDQIDKQEADFPVSLLLQWKKQHEDAVNTAMEGDSPLPLFTVPYPRHTCFKGRDDDLDNLRDLLVNGKKTALTQVIRGLGGIGKTQTAVEYAYRHKDDYKAILWVKAETELDIRQDMAEIARELKLADAEAKPDDAARALKIWLERTSDWLLVFDNADHPKLLKPVMPRASDGHVLLTSRASASEFDALHIRSSIELPLLSVDHAVEFLLERTERVGCDKGESDAARDLAEELGLLPIALEQAGAYIHELQLSFVGYLDKYRNRKQRLELLERGRPRMGDYPQSVATTWQVNFEEVEEESKPAADLFRLAAFLGPDNIPFELFLDGASAADCSSAKAVTESDDPDLALREALAKLERFSLVTVNGDEKTFSIHRLVQEAIKHAMNDADRRSWAERAVNMANEAAPDPEFEKWDLYRRLTRHAVAMLGHVKAFDIQTRAAGRLANQAGYFLYDQAEYAEAEPLYKQAMEIDRTALGEQHPDYATSLNNLAGLYRAMGRHTEAEPLYKQAMEIKRTALGEQHPGFAVSLNNLALLYNDMGRHTDAEPLYKQAMAICRTALGEQHPHYAVVLRGLAGLYDKMGRDADAAELKRQLDSLSE